MKKIFFSTFLWFLSLPVIGIANEPIIINTCEELQAINNNLSGDYLLTGEEIDCSNKFFEPIGSLDNEFTGHFDGNHVPITGLEIILPNNDYVGLFGAVAEKAYIENVIIIDANVNGKDAVGLLVGGHTENGTGTSVLFNNTVSGRISGIYFVGGLIGKSVINENRDGVLLRNNNVIDLSLTLDQTAGKYIGGMIGSTQRAEIDNCHAQGIIFGGGNYYSDIGGLVGEYTLAGTQFKNSSARVDITVENGFEVGGLIGDIRALDENPINEIGITNSFAQGKIIGEQYVGGLIGNMIVNQTIFIKDSYASGNVEGDMFVGGLIGYSDALLIENGYATGNVTAYTYYAGGLVGATADFLTIKNAYASGTVTAANYAGGLVGMLTSGEVAFAYAVGRVSSNNPTTAGGLIAHNSKATIIASFWDVESTGQTHSDGGTPAATEQLQTQEFYQAYGWDFYNVWEPIQQAAYPKFQYESK